MIVSWKVDFRVVINPLPHPDLVIQELGTDEVTVYSKPKAQKVLIYDPIFTISEQT